MTRSHDRTTPLVPGVRCKTADVARALLGSLLAVCAVLAMGCGSEGAEAYAEARTAVGANDLAPDFTLQDIDGNEFRLSDTSGSVRLIDFWATWCAPCREEIPMLNALESSFADQGFTVVAISDEDRDVISEFVDDQSIQYTNLVDASGVAEEYLVLGLPTAFLLDREGRIIERYTGPKPHKVLEKRIRELLDLPPTT